MDDDRSWLKNPIIPRPPGVPRFSSAELKLVNEERPSAAALGDPREVRVRRAKRRAEPRVSGTTSLDSSVDENALEQSRRSA